MLINYVNETTNFLKTVVFGKTVIFENKIHRAALNVVLHDVKKLWGS